MAAAKSNGAACLGLSGDLVHGQHHVPDRATGHEVGSDNVLVGLKMDILHHNTPDVGLRLGSRRGYKLQREVSEGAVHRALQTGLGASGTSRYPEMQQEV